MPTSPSALTWLLISETGGIPSSARVILFCLIGLLLVILGVLLAFALVVRRRAPAPQTVSLGNTMNDRNPMLMPSGGQQPLPSMSARGSTGGMMAVVATDEQVGCPTCGQEYEGVLRFCQSDARPLVPVSELTKLAGKGSLCTACGRSFDGGVPTCPNDGTELTPQNLYEATRGRPSVLHPTGITGRICPICRRRYDLAGRFCPLDGAELATIN